MPLPTAAKHSPAAGQATPDVPDAELPAVEGVHELPPSVEYAAPACAQSIVPLAGHTWDATPTTTQSASLQQAVPVGTIWPGPTWPDHVVSPSVVRRICPAPSLVPVAGHVVGLGLSPVRSRHQESAFRGPVPVPTPVPTPVPANLSPGVVARRRWFPGSAWEPSLTWDKDTVIHSQPLQASTRISFASRASNASMSTSSSRTLRRGTSSVSSGSDLFDFGKD
jgi:hypothetical protein